MRASLLVLVFFLGIWLVSLATITVSGPSAGPMAVMLLAACAYLYACGSWSGISRRHHRH